MRDLGQSRERRSVLSENKGLKQMSLYLMVRRIHISLLCLTLVMEAMTLPESNIRGFP